MARATCGLNQRPALDGSVRVSTTDPVALALVLGRFVPGAILDSAVGLLLGQMAAEVGADQPLPGEERVADDDAEEVDRWML